MRPIVDLIRYSGNGEAAWNQASPYAKRRQLENMRAMAPKRLTLWQRVINWLSEDC